ncbi:hypothetical protein NDU88_004332 [Pleurodeles waltl]|uniref:Uncharacterized protein n=1 Tax=Pleurodeles waltl TaxID=8319 RepID=A0AAV7VFX1_PLEWA|nr:hypothetical protein NDU88_004332 [Pleurodeles waltl]
MVAGSSTAGDKESIKAEPVWCRSAVRKCGVYGARVETEAEAEAGKERKILPCARSCLPTPLHPCRMLLVGPCWSSSSIHCCSCCCAARALDYPQPQLQQALSASLLQNSRGN